MQTAFPTNLWCKLCLDTPHHISAPHYTIYVSLYTTRLKTFAPTACTFPTYYAYALFTHTNKQNNHNIHIAT